MELTITQESGHPCFHVSGNIDEQGATILKGHFGKLNLESVKELVIDFGDVRHIGSSGIGKLLLIYKNLAAHGATMRIINVKDPIFELFQELKLDTLFSISRA